MTSAQMSMTKNSFICHIVIADTSLIDIQVKDAANLR